MIQDCIVEQLASCTMHTMRCNRTAPLDMTSQAAIDAYIVYIVGGVGVAYFHQSIYP